MGVRRKWGRGQNFGDLKSSPPPQEVPHRYEMNNGKPPQDNKFPQ